MKRAMLVVLAVGLMVGGLAAPARAEVTSTQPAGTTNTQTTDYTTVSVAIDPTVTTAAATTGATSGVTGLTVTLTRTSCFFFVCSTVYKFNMWKQFNWDR